MRNIYIYIERERETHTHTHTHREQNLVFLGKKWVKFEHKILQETSMSCKCIRTEQFLKYTKTFKDDYGP
jgi:hypothetical protein